MSRLGAIFIVVCMMLIAGCADDMSEQEDCLLRKRLIAFHHLAADDRYDLIYSVCAASYVDQRALVRYAETLIPTPLAIRTMLRISSWPWLQGAMTMRSAL